MAIQYIGVSDFTLQSEEPTRAYMELPTTNQVWKGAATKYADFLADHKEGTKIGTGYVVDYRGRDQGMYPEVTLTIAYPPDFTKYLYATSRANQTSSKSATVTADLTIGDGLGSVEYQVQKRVSFIAPQSIYTYFSSKKPDGPRFIDPTEKQSPILSSTVITADCDGTKLTYYGNAPSIIATAVLTPAAGRITSHEANPIPGTPWYKCQDIISWGFWGDE